MKHPTHRSARLVVIVAATAATLTLAGCGAAAPTGPTGSAAATTDLQDTTPAATGESGPITWANYRATATLDPIQAGDQPENTVINSLCEGLLMQEPDGTIAPWLAESVTYTTPTEITVQLRDGATFWDGSPVTADDVVFSLQRAMDPTISVWAQPLDRIQSVQATADDQVVITLTEPDYWLEGYLATAAGIVIEKDYATQVGAAYGTPPGNVMCSGPFTLTSWEAGGDLVITKNPDYWDTENAAQVDQITFVAAPSDADITTGLTSGSIDGTLSPVLGTYTQLAASDTVTVTTGWNAALDTLAVTDFDGPLGDLRVRQALSLALDRDAYIATAYPGGQASVPRTSTNSSTWRMDESVFEEVLGDEQPMTQDLEQAKALIDEAGVAGETIVMATTALPSVTAASNAVLQAADQIGLNVELQNYAVADYINIFYDPSARAGLDLVDTLPGPDFADPGAGLYRTSLPGAIYNYGGWSDDTVTDLLTQARATADVAERASLAAQADAIITAALPSIPLAEQRNSVVMSTSITGAPASGTYMSGPWSRSIGASGR